MAEKYTDESILTFGKYSFRKLCKVPVDYLLQLYKDCSSPDSVMKGGDLYKNMYKKDELLIEYIEDNLERLLASSQTDKFKSFKAKEHILNINPHRKSKDQNYMGLGTRLIGNRVQITCEQTGKLIYPSQKDAKYEINRIQKLSGVYKKPKRSYECEFCGGWHLTSISMEDWKKKKAE